jgi:hypothetical protein
MKIIDAIRAFFHGSTRNPAVFSASDGFLAASDAFDSAFDILAPYGILASNRYEIKRSLRGEIAAGTYEELVAASTDPADFEPYTEAYLDAHTAAMNSLTAAFDNLGIAFAEDSCDARLRTSAASPYAPLYKACCRVYTLAAEMYYRAAFCATSSALDESLQAAKDEAGVMLLEFRAKNPAEGDPRATIATANAMKAKTTERALKAKALEDKGRIAGAKADSLLAKARSAEAKAEAAIEGTHHGA